MSESVSNNLNENAPIDERNKIDSSVLSTPRRAFGDMKNAFVTPSRSTNCKNTNIIKKIKNDFEVFEEKDETVDYLSKKCESDVKKESSEEQFNRIDPDAPVDTVTFSDDSDDFLAPEFERDGNIVDLFCDMLMDDRLNQCIFSHWLTHEQMDLLKNGKPLYNGPLDLRILHVDPKHLF
ncbi:unnamed protein product [Dracunculus medinensis]|uniref:Uncharacterized protein n=1 Tax=Dracunculus medinensis TaxID=318479 RepID=A0A0N4UPS8_DRAME|nr:unnamed protein product [Dracunculus medinensis]